jgi:hypothetical protein
MTMPLDHDGTHVGAQTAQVRPEACTQPRTTAHTDGPGLAAPTAPHPLARLLDSRYGKLQAHRNTGACPPCPPWPQGLPAGDGT